MALERKDVCAKLDADRHGALKILCGLRGVTIGEFIEGLLVPEIDRFVRESIEAADELRRLGLTGKNRE